jgi:hypothetical protein
MVPKHGESVGELQLNANLYVTIKLSPVAIAEEWDFKIPNLRPVGKALVLS